MMATQAQRNRMQTRLGRKHQLWHPVCIHPPSSGHLFSGRTVFQPSVNGHYHYTLPVYQSWSSCSCCNLMKWLWKLLVIGLVQALDKSWVLLEQSHHWLSAHSWFFSWLKKIWVLDWETEHSAFQSVYCSANTPSSHHRSNLIALLSCVVSILVVMINQCQSLICVFSDEVCSLRIL